MTLQKNTNSKKKKILQQKLKIRRKKITLLIETQSAHTSHKTELKRKREHQWHPGRCARVEMYI